MLVLASSCATPISALTAQRHLATKIGPITICSAPAAKPDDASAIARALDEASPKLSKWGPLDRPVELYLLPTHFDLEMAVHRWNYGWLRAWAMYDDVLLQTPSTWASSDREVVELVAHELTHCLMYQRSGTPENWAKKGIPLWFREGMATWTAEQGYRWMTLEDLAAVFEEQTTEKHDPIADADELYQRRSGAVYAAAYHAFSFLMRRYGPEAVDRVMYQMSKGEQFDEAFHRGVGLTAAQFTAEFRRYVVWRAFRGTGKAVSAQ